MVRNVSDFLKIFKSNLVLGVEQTQDDSLVAISDTSVAFRGESRLDFYITVMIQPGQVPVGMFLFVKFFKSKSARTKLLW